MPLHKTPASFQNLRKMPNVTAKDFSSGGREEMPVAYKAGRRRKLHVWKLRRFFRYDFYRRETRLT